MKLLSAFLSGDFTPLTELAKKEQLEPLELRAQEETVVIARMKKLAKDPAVTVANALELVHMSYDEQEWERQSTIGDLVRPTPADRKAWEQYVKFIQLAVKLLSEYRGINGDWRSNRYDTIPTNDRSSMASMAAANVKENYTVVWDSASELHIVLEALQDGDNIYGMDCIVESASIYDVVHDVSVAIEGKGYIALEEQVSDVSFVIHVCDIDTSTIDKVRITK